jgi:hypothetical protein
MERFHEALNCRLPHGRSARTPGRRAIPTAPDRMTRGVFQDHAKVNLDQFAVKKKIKLGKICRA